MWEPVGPLPATVYWRRRCAVLATVLTLVGLAFATAGAPASTPVPAANRSAVPDDEPAPPPVAAGDGGSGSVTSAAPGTGAAPSDRAPSDPAPSDPAPGTPTPGAATGRGTAPGSAGPAPGGAATSAAPGSSAPAASAVPSAGPSTLPGPSPSAVPPPGSRIPAPFSAAADPSSERIRPDDTPRPSVSAQPAVPLPPSGPVPCTNAMLSATAELDAPVHRVGSRPVLRLVVANISGQPCVRDLDSSRQEIVVWSEDGGVRLWSSNDCVNAATTDLRTLVPGRPVAFAVTWGERTTTPGCRTARTVVPAGSYRLMVRLDDLISPPTPFIRTL